MGAVLLSILCTQLYAQQSRVDSIVQLLNISYINNKLDTGSFDAARELIFNCSLTDGQVVQIETAAAGYNNPENFAIRFEIFSSILETDVNQAINYGKLQIEKMNELALPELSNIRTRILSSLRIPFRNTTRIEDGFSYYTQKLNYYKIHNDSSGIAPCYFVLAGFYNTTGLIDLAVYNMKKSISYLDTSTQKGTWINNTYGIASYYSKKGDINESLKYFRLVLNEKTRTPFQNYTSIVGMANVFIRANQLDSAAHFINLVNRDTTTYFVAFRANFLQIKSLYNIHVGNLEEAENLLNKCWQLVRENNIPADAPSGIIAPDYYLALIRIKQNRLDEAITLLTRDIERLLNNNIEKLRDYRMLADLYNKTGKNDKAAETYSTFITLQDLLLADQAKYRSFSFEAEQLISEKELSIAKLENQNRISSLFRNFLIAIAMLLLLLAAGLYSRFQYKKKANKVLETTLSNLKSTQSKLIQLEKAEALRLKELDEVKTKMYTNITHEFRTPLTVILGMAQQVIENPKVQLRESLNMIIRNGQNLLTLVNQMLDLSKLETGKLTLYYQRADMVSYLEYIVESFHSLAQNKGVQLHFIPEVEQIIMDFDEVRMQQIVSNMLSNAIKFTPEGGHVYVSSNIHTDRFILTIKDTGIGIAEADLPLIFDRFYQSDGTHTRQGEGTGIGLALTRELVKIMEGTISVKSKKGKGAEFEVCFPLMQISNFDETNQKTSLHTTNQIFETAVRIDEGFLPALTTQVNKDKSSSMERPHILIADDNEDVRAYLTACLNNDYVIEIAQNGQECEDLAFNTIPDLIVLDVMMPFKDGFEVCKKLKSDERTSHIPIIMLTAKADLDSRLDGLEQGADDYLTKPFNKNELLLRIRNLLELRRQLQQYYRSTLEASLQQDNTPMAENPLSTSGSILHDAKKESRNPSIPLDNSLENAFVIKVRKAIESHLDFPDFDVEKLCRHLAMSHSQVHRKLSALTGLSATHFIRYVRLGKAKEMIKSSGYSIAAIAMDCGFNDPAYFSRVFKQEFGETPQGWREKNSG